MIRSAVNTPPGHFGHTAPRGRSHGLNGRVGRYDNSPWPVLCSSRRWRFFVNTVGSKLRPSGSCPRTNGTEDCTPTPRRRLGRCAQSRGRCATMPSAVVPAAPTPGPPSEHIRSNSGDRRSNASSAMILMVRRGWSFGTRSSGSTNASIVACGSRRPLMGRPPPSLRCGRIQSHRIAFPQPAGSIPAGTRTICSCSCFDKMQLPAKTNVLGIDSTPHRSYSGSLANHIGSDSDKE